MIHRLIKSISILILITLSLPLYAQWVPTGNLARIPVIENCLQTKGDIAVAVPGVIFFCQATANRLNSRHPGAGHFYYVHEFGHHALKSSDERAVDCWAAQQLAATRGGGKIIRIAIKHFRSRGNEYQPRYGTMNERAARIARCASGR